MFIHIVLVERCAVGTRDRIDVKIKIAGAQGADAEEEGEELARRHHNAHIF